MSAEALLYSAISGLEWAAADLFTGSKRAEELQHRLIFEALAARAGGLNLDVARSMRDQVLAAIDFESDADTARAAFDSILEPVLIAVMQAMQPRLTSHDEADVVERIVDEEIHHSGGPCESVAVYAAAVRGAVKTLTCPFFARPLTVVLGPETSALGFHIREIFRRARTVRGVDPARVFGLCPMLRGEAEPLPMSAWAKQRVRGTFLSPMLQAVRVEHPAGTIAVGYPSPRAIEAAVVKAAAELVRDPRFNVVLAGEFLYRLADPVVTVRRMSDGVDLVNVPLPTHDAAQLSVDGFVRRIARRDRILRKTRDGWWDPAGDGAPSEDVLALPVVSGVIATISSLAHQVSPFDWYGFATPETSEGATYNVLITGNAPGRGFSLSIACDHRAIDGHVMGEFGLALSARAAQLLGFLA